MIKTLNKSLLISLLVSCHFSSVNAMEDINLGSDKGEDFEFTQKSTSHKVQINIEKINAIGKLKVAFEEAFRIVAEELKVNGIETGLMENQQEPNLEIVKLNLPKEFDQTTPQTHNLIELAYYYWQLKELYASCMEVIKNNNFINFEPIEKTIKETVEDRNNRVIQYLFPDINRNKLDALLMISDKNYIALEGSIILIENYKDCEVIQVNGPLPISVLKNQYIMYWAHINRHILNSPFFYNQFLKKGLAFTEKASNNSFLTKYSYSSSKNYFLNSLYITYQKVKSDRIYAFDPLAKCVPEDIINDEVKRQVKLSHHCLTAEYYEEVLNDDIQEPKSTLQTKVKFKIIKNNAEKYALEKSPTEAELRALMHDCEAKRQVKILYHGLKAEYYQNILNGDTQESKNTLQTQVGFKRIKENAEKYAWERRPSEAVLKAHVMRQYKENYEQMENLQSAIASLDELYDKAICLKMEENKIILAKIFAPKETVDFQQ